MKNTQKGYIVPLVIAIIALLILGGVYEFSKNNPAGVTNPVVPIHVSTSTPPTTPTSPVTPTPPNTLVPAIKSISPASGPTGINATLVGTGFLSTNTVLFGGGPVNNASMTNNGTALTFTVPNSVGADCKPNEACPMYARLITPGTYTVSVRNVNGTSNSVTFVVADASMGTLQGQATATMVCPHPETGRCNSPTDYTQFGVKIYQGDTLVQQKKLNADGTFTLNLEPGTYKVYADNQTPDTVTSDSWTSSLPQQITISQGNTTSLNFTINYTQY